MTFNSVGCKMTHAKLSNGDIAVYLDGRRVGSIVPAIRDYDPKSGRRRGFAYVSSGWKRREHGDEFPTVEEVLSSIL